MWLSKRHGLRPILEEISFSVMSGEVYAPAGPNGSGKTALIRLFWSGWRFPAQVRRGSWARTCTRVGTESAGMFGPWPWLRHPLPLLSLPERPCQPGSPGWLSGMQGTPAAYP